MQKLAETVLANGGTIIFCSPPHHTSSVRPDLEAKAAVRVISDSEYVIHRSGCVSVVDPFFLSFRTFLKLICHHLKIAVKPWKERQQDSRFDAPAGTYSSRVKHRAITAVGGKQPADGNCVVL